MCHEPFNARLNAWDGVGASQVSLFDVLAWCYLFTKIWIMAARAPCSYWLRGHQYAVVGHCSVYMVKRWITGLTLLFLNCPSICYSQEIWIGLCEWCSVDVFWCSYHCILLYVKYLFHLLSFFTLLLVNQSKNTCYVLSCMFIAVMTSWWLGTCFILPYIWNVIIPIDFHIVHRGRAQPTTRWSLLTYCHCHYMFCGCNVFLHSNCQRDSMASCYYACSILYHPISLVVILYIYNYIYIYMYI